VLRVVLGLGESTNWPAGVKAIYLWAPTYRRALYLGIFDAGAAIGTASAFPLMVVLTQRFGWRVAFGVIGAIGLVWLFFWWPNVPEQEARPALAGRAPWRELLRQRVLWGLVLTRFFATPVWWFYVFWLSDYLAVERGMTLMQLGLWGWLPYLSVDLGKIFGGRLSDYWSVRGKPFLVARRQVMAMGAVIMPAGALAVTAPTVTMAVLWAAVGTFGFGLWSVNILAIHADVFPETQIATAVGITTAAGGMGGAVFSWLTGQIVNAAGYTHAFTLTAATAVLAYGILYLFTQVRRRMEGKV
jgi:ACS family hexuronate transporter-like MFS transporter